MHLDAKSLRHVLALATHRNFGRAAAALHLSQPALSRSLVALEQTLGVQLFDRSRRGVTPTGFGQLLIDRGGALIAGFDDIRQEIESMRGLHRGSLNISAGLYPAEMSVGTAIGRLSLRYPALRVSLRAVPWRDVTDAITSSVVDIAVVELSTLAGQSHLTCDPLPRHQAVFVCRAGQPLLGETSPTLKMALRYPFVGPRLPSRVAAPLLSAAEWFRRDPLTGDLVPPLHVESIALARRIVATGDAIAALPRVLVAADIAAGRLVALPWQPDWLHTNYGFVYRRDRTLSPAVQAFIAEVRAIEASLEAPPARARRSGTRRNAARTRARAR